VTEHQQRSFNRGRTPGGTPPLFDKNFDRTAYDNGRFVRACETPWFRNEQNGAPSNAGLGSGLLFLVGLAVFAVFAVAAIISGLINPPKAENFTQAPEPPLGPPVYRGVQRISSTPVLIGPEGVQLRQLPDFSAKFATCVGPCPPGPMFANTTVMMNGKNDGWVHLVADYTDGWAPPGSAIQAAPPKQLETPSEQPSTDQTTVATPQSGPQVHRPIRATPQ
jgi:hypothetical protein